MLVTHWNRLEEPDHIVVHAADQCDLCGATLTDVEAEDYQKRQVFDIPPVKIEVTEHQAEIKTCPRCGRTNVASFPPDVTASVQYSNRIRSRASLHEQLPVYPVGAHRGLFRGHLRSPPNGGGHSSGECKMCRERKTSQCGDIRELLIHAHVVNFDETGLRVEDKLNWLHVASTPDLTHYTVHHECAERRRWTRVEILSEFGGVAMHDHWKPYFNYTDVIHALLRLVPPERPRQFLIKLL